MSGTSEGAKKAYESRTKENIKKFHQAGGKVKTKGYFGWLKERHPKKFKELSSKAGKKKRRVVGESKTGVRETT